MARTITQAFTRNFLGQSPDWYKLAIIGFLLFNPIVVLVAGKTIAGWLLVLEFIFTLAMALKCYPLAPGGLLAIEAILLGLTTPDHVYEESLHQFPVIMLLIFMVAGIFFLKELLLFTFTKIVLGIRSKVLLSLLFCAVAAVLSAFLDALTVTAVIITVGGGFYSVYHKVASGKQFHHDDHDQADDELVHEEHRTDLARFRAFLRQLMMHGAVGTALGGVTTIVGEPQNLLIGKTVGWEFVEFFLRMAPVSIPVFFTGLATCALVEQLRILGYGATLPDSVRDVLTAYDEEQKSKRGLRERAILIAQGFVVVVLVLSLGFHVAEIGIVGLMVIVLATSLTGVIEESRIAHAFEEALPFTALLVVFFAIVAVINDQQLFHPVIEWVLSLEGKTQLSMFFVANGVLSMVSDNVFVASVYIRSVQDAFNSGAISRESFELLAIAINTGTNIPSVATPNGQAAFLFLLTSALAPLIRLSYSRMVLLALPYTVTMSTVGLLAVIYIL
ncbi:MAG: sodium/proton antiporter NhaB [Gammaproteobacteria bacterium]|nr:sodium/proton antiporter NhaB [Gammaproteobacteria bacterium]MDH3769178.1 sodium/proton antiporter NhaB [Gammaproteobacteria bacterium]